MSIQIALQLYTVRDETAKDFIGTLEKVAEIGYKGVEFAGYGDIPAAEMRAALDRLGLKACGSHVGLDLLKNKLEEIIEYNLTIGSPHIICPWDDLKTKEDFLKAAELYNGIGEKCKAKGLQFCYHNHAHELVAFDGEYGLDIMYNNTNPDYMQAEIDTFWVVHAGLEPAAYVRKYSGRCPLVHLKDMESKETKDFAEVGNGIIDIRAIVEAGKEAGAQWFVVEQDRCKRPSLESVKISYENLQAMKL